jgi:hypothetical protein
MGRALALLQGRVDRGSGALDWLHRMRCARRRIRAAAHREHDGKDHRGKSVLAEHGGVSLAMVD